MLAPAVDCRNVSVRFLSERRTVTALDNVSFSVEPGGFTSLLGPSGCGKSTLLRVVADLIAPSEGDVTVLGTSPEEARKARALGFVFQDAALLPWRTPCRMLSFPSKSAASGLSRMARRHPKSFSRWLASRGGSTVFRTNSRVACGSAWPSPGRCLAGRASY